MDDVVMGYVGAAASWLQRGQGRARSLLLDHCVLSWLLGANLRVLLAESLRPFLPLRFGVNMGFEVLLKGSFDPLALQIQKHEKCMKQLRQSTLISCLPAFWTMFIARTTSSNNMSESEYNRKIEECRRQLNALRKDIQYRSEQVLRNEPTFAIDAEIRGQFAQADEDLAVLRQILQNFQSKSKELSIMPRELEKRRNAYQVNVDERDKLKRTYDENVALRVPNTVSAKAADDMDKFKAEYNAPLDKKQLLALKQKQEQAQDEAIDDLIGAVKVMKTGQGQIRKQLVEQQVLLDNLGAGMDQNSENMSKITRNLNKLLQSSSYTCLILIILLEIAGIICNLIFWKK